MITKRDEKTGALIYLKSREDIEKEKTNQNLKDLNKKIMLITTKLDNLEETFEKVKNIEKQLNKIEKKIKDILKDGD